LGYKFHLPFIEESGLKYFIGLGSLKNNIRFPIVNLICIETDSEIFYIKAHIAITDFYLGERKYFKL